MPKDKYGQKWACESCIKGHRSEGCKHWDRFMLRVKRPGRPVRSCQHVQQPCLACAPGSYMMVKLQMPDGSCCCEPRTRNPTELARQAEQGLILPQNMHSQQNPASNQSRKQSHSSNGLSSIYPIPYTQPSSANPLTAPQTNSGPTQGHLHGENVGVIMPPVNGNISQSNGSFIPPPGSASFQNQTVFDFGNPHFTPVNGSFHNLPLTTRNGYQSSIQPSTRPLRPEQAPSGFKDANNQYVGQTPAIENALPFAPAPSETTLPFNLPMYSPRAVAEHQIQMNGMSGINHQLHPNSNPMGQLQSQHTVPSQPEPFLNPNSTFCTCDDGCNCLYCPVHPYNTSNQKLVNELVQTLRDDGALESEFSSRPQSQEITNTLPEGFASLDSLANGVDEHLAMQPPGGNHYSTFQYEVPGDCAQNKCQCGVGCRCDNCATHQNRN